MIDNAIFVEIENVNDIDVDVGEAKFIVETENKVEQAIPQIEVDEKGLITAISNQKSGSVSGGVTKSFYQMAVEHQKKIYPKEYEQVAFPKNTYSLGEIIVAPINVQEKEIKIEDDGNYEILPDNDYTLSKAKVIVDTSQKREEEFEAGKKAAYDAFWDAFQQNGNRTSYISAFGAQWTPEIFKPKYPIKPVNAYYMFFNNEGGALVIPDFVQFCKENNVVLDFSECINANYAIGCLWTNHLGVLDFRKCSRLNNLFYSQTWAYEKGIKKIDEFISSEITVFNDTTFQYAPTLTEIKMSGVVASNINFSYCTKLSHDSIISIINALSTTTTGLTVTLSLTAVNKAFETSEGANDGSTSDEWLALVATRSNWTIALA